MNTGAYIGLEYKDRGRGPDSFDCLGFVGHVYLRELGIALPDFLDAYHSAEDSRGCAEAINKRKVDWAPVDKPEPLDLMLFKVFGLPTHVGLYLNEWDFLHCFKGTGSCIERHLASGWGNRLLGFYRWNG